MEKMGVLLRFIWRSSKRAVVFVIGVAMLTVGLIMFVTPGPGIVFVVLGLAVLATEFAWAEHLLDQARRQASRAGQASQKIPGVGRAWAWLRARWPWGRRPESAPAVAEAVPAEAEPPSAAP
jgi:Putative transmembrane protein (PGPGW)